MIDVTVLRGFCQKCGWPIQLEEGMEKGLHVVLDSDTGLSTNPLSCDDYKMKPVWFLSAKQMTLIRDSKELHTFWVNNGKGPALGYRTFTKNDCIPIILEVNPFLVAKILQKIKEHVSTMDDNYGDEEKNDFL